MTYNFIILIFIDLEYVKLTKSTTNFDLVQKQKQKFVIQTQQNQKFLIKNFNINILDKKLIFMF
ncbi:hypothetical protein pb186bvf_008592 [Paramecium bursaria]